MCCFLGLCLVITVQRQFEELEKFLIYDGGIGLLRFMFCLVIWVVCIAAVIISNTFFEYLHILLVLDII